MLKKVQAKVFAAFVMLLVLSGCAQFGTQPSVPSQKPVLILPIECLEVPLELPAITEDVEQTMLNLIRHSAESDVLRVQCRAALIQQWCKLYSRDRESESKSEAASAGVGVGAGVGAGSMCN